MNQATGLKAKAGRLQETAAELLTKAKVDKEEAAALKEKYYKTMDEYSKAVAAIDVATQKAQGILDQMNAQSLVLAQVGPREQMRTPIDLCWTITRTQGCNNTRARYEACPKITTNELRSLPSTQAPTQAQQEHYLEFSGPEHHGPTPRRNPPRRPVHAPLNRPAPTRQVATQYGVATNHGKVRPARAPTEPRPPSHR